MLLTPRRLTRRRLTRRLTRPRRLIGEKELVVDEPDGAQDYRTRVEEAQLPGRWPGMALCEVDMLERTSDQSPESGDIRTWLDTTSSTCRRAPGPWIVVDIQGHAKLRRHCGG